MVKARQRIRPDIFKNTFSVRQRSSPLIKKGDPLIGFRQYHRPLLISYSRSGTNWLRYIIEFLTKKPTPGSTRLVEGNGYIIDRAHQGFRVINKHNKAVLTIRNYKECLLRHLMKEWKDFQNTTELLEDLTKEWKNFQNVTGFLEDWTTTQPPYWYIKNIEAFDKFRGDKLLIYYEDMIIDPIKEIKRLVTFLKLPETHLKHLLENLDYHKKQSISCYRKDQKSYTEGASDKLRYYSEILLSSKERREFDNYYEKNYPILFKKYLTRYKEF
ncbi:MAG: sulfotransferase domain-containing protein [Promethearchaeota archaeon]